MASLYSHKEKNIRRTWALFTGFLVVLVGFGWLMSSLYENPVILVVAAVFSIVMSVVGYFGSDRIVLALAHARPVTAETAPELHRIVENLAITAGLPMPRIYIIPERAPNAFATGRDPHHAVVAVTEGLLQKLDRSELEGVLAHELSHIGNRDMLVGTVAVILVGFISILGDMFLRSALWGGGRGRNGGQGGAGPVLFLIGVGASILAPLSAVLIQLAISRRREFLADASGAFLTRYPEGLAQALEKIAADATPLRAANNTTAHLWLTDPFKAKQRGSFLHKLFMTHPPIEERIKALKGLKI
ncbi:MAG: M48 family metallopeptidase [Candidatus Liptonbacteria bacterium]|nr:M48 family metallopeptidase [Candidatus Liptonbacteria bacterium]